jgi:hypothetical protein
MRSSPTPRNEKHTTSMASNSYFAAAHHRQSPPQAETHSKAQVACRADLEASEEGHQAGRDLSISAPEGGGVGFNSATQTVYFQSFYGIAVVVGA